MAAVVLLVVAARDIDPNYHAEISAPWTDPDDDVIATSSTRAGWRMRVPPTIRRLWSRLDYEAKLAVFVVAASEFDTDWPADT